LPDALGDSKTPIFVDPTISKVLVSSSRAKTGSTEIGILEIWLDDLRIIFSPGQ